MTTTTSKKATLGTLNSKALVLTVPIFVLSIFTSALLLFAVQPLFTKMALPALGGAPNVWNTAMVFFQGVLLLGYLYAHLSSKFLPLRAQILCHLTVLGVGLLFLPIALPINWAAPAHGAAQGLWLIAMMGVALGAPFFALSANAPLLQRWFSYTGHRTAQDPYYLYAASNLGSILSLLAYPFVIEPALGLTSQSEIWQSIYWVLISFIACAGLVTLAWPRVAAKDQSISSQETSQSIAISKKLGWIGLAFVPSGFMLAVTTHLTTDVTPAPFLWIIPLTLYLLSFVVVFSSFADKVRNLLSVAAPIILIAVAVLAPLVSSIVILAWALHIGVFFVVCLVCHGELAKRRPPTDKLTEFYLIMSFGGVLGGIFTALLAPVLFSGIWEYAILFILASYITATFSDVKRALPYKKYGILILALVLSTIAIFALNSVSKSFNDSFSIMPAIVIAVTIIALIAYANRYQKVIFTLAISCVIMTVPILRESVLDEKSEIIFQDRSFFGVVSVKKLNHSLGVRHNFIHGSTVHNAQLRDDDLQTLPVLYFSLVGPYGDVTAAIRAKTKNPRFAVIGLGAGALACHKRDGEVWNFYEIDPLIAKVARNDKLFSFMNKCAPDAPITIGDGRLSLVAEAESGAEKYDVIFLDAFSSDSIPGHLITREAMMVYRERLNPGGIIMVHTSNRYLDVSSVAIAAAQTLNLDWRAIPFRPTEEQEEQLLAFGADAVVIGDKEVIEAAADGRPLWVKKPANPIVRPWTDDYSNILAAMKAKRSSADK